MNELQIVKIGKETKNSKGSPKKGKDVVVQLKKHSRSHSVNNAEINISKPVFRVKNSEKSSSIPFSSRFPFGTGEDSTDGFLYPSTSTTVITTITTVNGTRNVRISKTNRNRDTGNDESEVDIRYPRSGTHQAQTISVSDRRNTMAAMVTVNEGTKVFIQRFLSVFSSININSKDERGNTILHYACLLGQVDLVRALIRRGAKVTDTNNKGMTALHYAACKSSMLHTMCVETCCMNGGKVNARTLQGMTPLHYAVSKGRLSAKAGNISCVQLLCQRWKAEACIKDLLNQQIPLHYAALHGHFQICNLLVERSKSSVNIRDRFDRTPLHIAIIYGHLEICRLLLLRGSSIGAITKDGSTVLHLGCKYKRNAIVDLLLNNIEHQPKYFSLISKRDRRGFTCVHWSAIKGDLETLSLFPEGLDGRDIIGLTPCFWAVLRGKRACVSSLIANQVEINHPDFDQGKSSILFPMAQSFLTEVGSSLFSDATIVIEGRSIPVHKVMLYRCFRRFLSMDNRHQTIIVQNQSYNAFMDFCTYLYTGLLPENDVQLLQLREAAVAYGLPGLCQNCENALLNKGKCMCLSSLPMHMATALAKSIYSDVTILVEGKAFRLHRFILYCRSVFFQRLLGRPPIAPPPPPVYIPSRTSMEKFSRSLSSASLFSALARLEHNRNPRSSPSMEDSMMPPSPPPSPAIPPLAYGIGSSLSVSFSSGQLSSFLEPDSDSRNLSESPAVIDLPNVSKRLFPHVLDYLYTDSLRKVDLLMNEELQQLWELAKQLELEGLMRICEYHLFERVNDTEIVDIFYLAESSEMHLLHKACLDYMAKGYKKSGKGGLHLDGLASHLLDEVRRRKKELKKQQGLEEKEKKKLERILKKIQRSSLKTNAKNSPTSPAAILSTSPTTLFASSPPPSISNAPSISHAKTLLAPSTPLSFFSKRAPLESKPYHPKLVRRNSAEW